MKARHVVGALAILGCTSGPANPPQAPRTGVAERSKGSIELHVCFQNASLFGERTPGLGQVVERLRGVMLAQGASLSRIGVGPCGEQYLAGCFGRPGLIACRADDIAQLVTAASLTAALSTPNFPTSLARFTRTGAVAPSDAIAALARDVVEDQSEGRAERIDWVAQDLEVPREVVAETVASSERLWESPFNLAEQPIVDDAIGLVLEFLVGHELAHGRGERCEESRLAASEDDGLFRFASDAASSRQLFCSNAPSANELRADRCGLRMLRYGALATRVSNRAPAAAQLSIAIASDLIAWAIMTNHAENLLTGPKQRVMREVPGYLHPALRVTMITNELRQTLTSSTYHGMCDRVARNVVIALQEQSQRCPETEQEIDDMLLHRLPPGVAAAWVGQDKWRDPESFWCSRQPSVQ